MKTLDTFSVTNQGLSAEEQTAIKGGSHMFSGTYRDGTRWTCINYGAFQVWITEYGTSWTVW